MSDTEIVNSIWLTGALRVDTLMTKSVFMDIYDKASDEDWMSTVGVFQEDVMFKKKDVVCFMDRTNMKIPEELRRQAGAQLGKPGLIRP